ncbi:MAG TPA: CoA ester lyase [Solirubrobacteraceae bacterium]|jgi:citrate lyase subunit beta/citryl-CoA lyase|nr:CoA ester lyase [Solirubrobacteraceae bacterium]
MSAVQTRSQLYVPGHRADWFAKAIATGADGLILDLEDSVPEEEKGSARATVVEFIRSRAGLGSPVLLVRINDSESTHFLDDVIDTVEAGVDVLVLPKVFGASDVIALDGLVSAVERRCGREPGSALIHPILETAGAIRDAFAIGGASPRVAYMGGMSARGGDIERGLGFRWSAGGEETFGFRARALLDARAAGVPHPVSGTWTEIEDLEGMRSFACESRDLGYEGMVLIHPSHVAIANEVFSPSAEDLERDRMLIAAMGAAEAEGLAAIRFDGHMVDIAMVTRARERLARAEAGESS